MERLHFTVHINASPEKVWKSLWDDASYRTWTSVFGEGSHAVSDWKEGSSIQFLGASGEGMHSIIVKNTPYEFMSFKHLGMIKDGKEQPADEATESWSGSMENYTLSGTGNTTRLTVDIDITEPHKDYFEETFPKALQKVKELAEQS